MEIYALNHFYLQEFVVVCDDFTVLIVIILFCIEFRKRNPTINESSHDLHTICYKKGQLLVIYSS